MHCKSFNYILIRNADDQVTSNLNKKVLSLITNKTLFNSNTSSILYEGENLNIKISNNTKKDVEIARSMKLGIVDYGDCEEILKKNNIIPQHEHLYSLTTNVKNSNSNNTKSFQNTLQVVCCLFLRKLIARAHCISMLI